MSGHIVSRVLVTEWYLNTLTCPSYFSPKGVGWNMIPMSTLFAAMNLTLTGLKKEFV